mmetsp:Transcript_23900/g.62073  ORF Transcript_23900/g.62073 Transcript_23900/m.62073 type:complete len:372 (-) Transcript_23900:214-1329(-)
MGCKRHSAGHVGRAAFSVISRCLGVALLLFFVNSRAARVTKGTVRKATATDHFHDLPPVCQRLLSRRLNVTEYPPLEGRPPKFRLLMPTRLTASLCVPQKNGNMFWSGLSHASVYKTPVVLEGKKYSTRPLYVGLDTSNMAAAYMLARNPYVRALSLYLDKVKSSCKHERGGQGGVDCKKNVYNNRNGGVKLPTPPEHATFEQYMQFVDEQYTKTGSMCKINFPDHACLQTSICLEATHRPVFLLKTEEQDLWYPCMVQYLELGSVMSSPGWRTFTGKHCFHHPAGKTCEQALELPSKAALLAGSKDATLATGTLHATSAWSRLYDHYTSAAAEIVTRLYAKDFEILNYPTWDGIGNFSVNFPFETAQSYR